MPRYGKIYPVMKIKSKDVINLIWSAVFGACIATGMRVEKTIGEGIPAIVYFLIWIAAGAVTFLIMTRLDKVRKDATCPSLHGPFPKKFFFTLFISFFILYIPALLAAFPGFFCYDANTESYMVFTFKYSNHHPLIHELLLGNCLRVGYRLFGNYNAGVTIYVIFQMIVMSAVFAFLLATLKQINVKKPALIISFIFPAFFPTIRMFVVCTTKDVLFSAGIVLFTTALLRYIIAHQKSDLWILFIGTCMILFFRNNGIYILPIPAIVIFIFFKEHRKTLIPIITGIVLYIVTIETLIALLPAKRGEQAEMLSVPMQQLARAYTLNKESFTQEELDTLYNIFPEVILERYNPKLADDIKFNFLEDNFKADNGRYAKLWWNIFLKNPGHYMDAFLIMTDGYWYPGTAITGYEGKLINTITYGESAYFQYESEPPAVASPIFKGLNSFYKSLSLDIKWQRIPVLNLILSPATYVWLFLFAMAISLKTKNDLKLLFIMPFLLLLTLLLGPIALVRYALPFMMMTPLTAIYLFDIKKGISK